MTSKYTNKCSTSLVTKEMQIKRALRFHLTQLQWPYSKAIAANTGEDGAKQEPLCIADGNANSYNH
jgi:hypothetical protein